MSDAVKRLADALGIDPEAPAENRRAIVEAMGFDTKLQRARDTVERLEVRPWTRIVPSCLVLWPGEDTVPIRVAEADAEKPFEWRLTSEAGDMREGRTSLADLDIIDARDIDGMHFQCLAWPLPAELSVGYYTLTATVATYPQGDCRLVITPGACYLPASFGRKIWGIASQLYSLRSQRNWGMGDFTDLKEMGRRADGAGVIGLNPMHALLLPKAGEFSPYAPASRCFYNPYYIDAEAVPEWPAVSETFSTESFQRQKAKAQAAELVDYQTVTSLKDRAIDALYEAFETSHGRYTESARRGAYETFKKRRGEPLRQFAIFEALRRHLMATDGLESWHQWPAAYRDADSRAVTSFAEARHAAVERNIYAQWLAEEQLDAAAEAVADADVPLGLYFDLAVGVNRDGFDVWQHQALFGARASVGAPPDMFTDQGQDWGIPPPDPLTLADEGYESFIQMIRANMRHAGALRIDHVMSLERLFWVPTGGTGRDGAYVAYPYRDLLGILALESHRDECVVIGEDLGNVPEGFRDRMADANVLSYRLLYFERDEEGEFRAPADYPEKALATVGTHDLPPLTSFWKGSDIDRRARLGLAHVGEKAWQKAHDTRRKDIRRLIAAMHEAGVADEVEEGDDEDIFRAVYKFLATSNAWIAMAQIEDIAGEEEQVNLPGSHNDQHPNWQRRLEAPLERILTGDRFADLQALMARHRGTGSV